MQDSLTELKSALAGVEPKAASTLDELKSALAGVAPTDAPSRLDAQFEQLTDEQREAAESIRNWTSVGTGLQTAVSSPIEFAGAVGQLVGWGDTDDPNVLRRAAGAIRGAYDYPEWAKIDGVPIAEQTVASDVLQGFGSMGAFMATGGTASLAGLGMKGASRATYAFGSMMEAESMFRDAEAQGASDAQMWGALATGSLLGQVERLGALEIGGALARIDRKSGGRFRRAVEGAGRTLRDGGIEGAEELLQSLGGDIAAQYVLRYAEPEDLLTLVENAGYSGFIGTIVGTGTSAGQQAAYRVMENHAQKRQSPLLLKADAELGNRVVSRWNAEEGPLFDEEAEVPSDAEILWAEADRVADLIIKAELADKSGLEAELPPEAGDWGGLVREASRRATEEEKAARYGSYEETIRETRDIGINDDPAKRIILAEMAEVNLGSQIAEAFESKPKAVTAAGEQEAADTFFGALTKAGANTSAAKVVDPETLDKATVRELEGMAKRVGFNLTFVDGIEGGKFPAYYTGGRVVVDAGQSLDALRAMVFHEAVHHAAPAGSEANKALVETMRSKAPDLLRAVTWMHERDMMDTSGQMHGQEQGTSLEERGAIREEEAVAKMAELMPKLIKGIVGGQISLDSVDLVGEPQGRFKAIKSIWGTVSDWLKMRINSMLATDLETREAKALRELLDEYIDPPAGSQYNLRKLTTDEEIAAAAKAIAEALESPTAREFLEPVAAQADEDASPIADWSKDMAGEAQAQEPGASSVDGAQAAGRGRWSGEPQGAPESAPAEPKPAEASEATEEEGAQEAKPQARQTAKQAIEAAEFESDDAAADRFATLESLPPDLVKAHSGRILEGVDLTVSFGPANYERNLERLERVAKAMPAPAKNRRSWNRFIRSIFGGGELTLAGPEFIFDIASPEGMASYLDQVPADMRTATTHGLEIASRIGARYKAGEVTPAETGMALQWVFMSRMLSAAPHESAHLAARAESIDEFLQVLADDAWTAKTSREYKAWVKRWFPKKSAGDRRGEFHNSARANMNAFGKWMEVMAESTIDGTPALQWVNQAVADGAPSLEIRRKYMANVLNAGMGNKLFSFFLLISGRTDVVVIDRWQARNFWSQYYDRVTREMPYGDPYDGIAKPKGPDWTPTYIDKKTGKEKKRKDPSGGVADVIDGPHGVAIYEALERTIDSHAREYFEGKGVPFGGAGRLHWESWLDINGQIVGHTSLEAFLADPPQWIGVTEGRTGEKTHGVTLLFGPDGARMYAVPDVDGSTYLLPPETYGKLDSPRGSRPARQRFQDGVRAGTPLADAPVAIRDAVRSARPADAARAGERGVAPQQPLRADRAAVAEGPRVATLFSGMGTVEAALGAQGVLAVEFDGEVVEAHNAAHGTSWEPRSVWDLDPAEVAALDPDLCHMSPVCKNFSAAKRAATVDEDDMKSAQKVADVILEASPRAVTIENVAGYRDTIPYREITDALDAAGYTWDEHVVDAADLGGAQLRSRVIVRGVLEGELPPMPKPQEPGDWYELVKDLVDDAPASQIPAWEDGRIADMIERGTLDPSLPIITMGGTTGRTVAAARNAGGPSTTLVSSGKSVPRIRMPDGREVKVTSRMMARLMGLPDTTVVPEKPSLAKKVLGNGIHGEISRQILGPLLPASDRQAVTESPAFRAWFGDSKVVDSQGRPLVVYHGTTGEFSAFSRMMLGLTTGAKSAARGFFFIDRADVASEYAEVFGNRGEKQAERRVEALEAKARKTGRADDWDAHAAAVDEYERIALAGSRRVTVGANVMPVYLSMQNPRVYDFKGRGWEEGRMDAETLAARRGGNDGVIFRNVQDDPGPGEPRVGDVYVAFRPEQIKSVHNRGTWDASNPDIREATTEYVGLTYEETRMQRKYNRWVDAFAPVRRVQEDLGPQLESRDVSKAETLFYGKLNEEVAKRRKEYIPELRDILGRRVTLEQADKFLWYLAAPERNETAIKREDEVRQRRADRRAGLLARREWDKAKRAYDKWNEEKASGKNLRRPQPPKPEGKRPPMPTKPKLERVTRDGKTVFRYPSEQIDGWDHEIKPASGVATSEAEAYTAKMLAGKDGKRYKRLRAWNRRLQNDRLEYLLEHGLIHRELYDKIQAQGWKDYVPLRHVMRGKQALRKGRKFQAGGDPIRKFKGRQIEPDSPVLMSLMQWDEAIVQRNKAVVGRSLLELARANEDSKFWTVVEAPLAGAAMSTKAEVAAGKEAGVLRALYEAKVDRADQAIKVMDTDGKAYYVVFAEEAANVAHALNGVGVSQVGEIVSTLSAVTRWFAAINTSYNPEFAVRNFIRDLIFGSTGMYVEHGAKAAAWTAAHAPAAIRAIGRYHDLPGFKEARVGAWREWIDLYLESGAKTGWYYGGEIDDQMRELQTELRKGLKARNPREAAAKSWAAFSGVIEGYNMSVENGVRLAAFRYLIEKKGMSVSDAAVYVKNMTVNFNRKGELGAQYGGIYMFLNAAIQGTTRYLELVKKGPGVAVTVVGAGILQSMINAWLAWDDDDGENAWDSQPEGRKDIYMMAVIPGTERFAAMPMPYGYNSLFTLGRVTADVARGAKTPGEGVTASLASAMGSMWPLGGFDGDNPVADVARMVAPTPADPLVDLISNQTWSGSTISPRFDDTKPRSEQYWDDTNGVWVGMSKALNFMTGGDEIEGGLLDVSPNDLEYVFGQLTGGVGRFGAKTVDAISTGFDEGLAEGVFRAPVVRDALPGEGDYKWFMAFRANELELGMLMRRYDQAIGKGRGDEYLEENRALLALALDNSKGTSPLKDVKKRVRRLERRIDQTEDDEAIAAFEDEIKEATRAFNRMASAARRAD